MNIAETMAFLGALMLFFVVSLSVLPAFSKMMARNAKTEEARRSWEGGCLIWLVFLLMLAIVVWRAS
jgi:NADH:ubiquinone oxidoreductase subunit 6 (subunit J)